MSQSFDLSQFPDLPPEVVKAVSALQFKLSVERAARQHEQAVVAGKDAFITELKALIKKLEGQVQDYRRTKFGPKSEKPDPAQLDLALEDLETAMAGTQAQIAATEDKIAASATVPDKAAPRAPRQVRGLCPTCPAQGARALPHVPRARRAGSAPRAPRKARALPHVPRARCAGSAPRAPRKARALPEHLPEHLPRIERVIEPDSIACPCGCGDMVRIGEAEEGKETVRGAVSPTMGRSAGLHPGALSGHRHDPPRVCLPQGAHRCGAGQGTRAFAGGQLAHRGAAGADCGVKAVRTHAAQPSGRGHGATWRADQPFGSGRLDGPDRCVDCAGCQSHGSRAEAGQHPALRPLSGHCCAMPCRAMPCRAMDETTAPVLDPGRGKTRTGYLWAVLLYDRGWNGTAPPGVVFHYRHGRKGEYAAEILHGFNGTIQVPAHGLPSKPLPGNGCLWRLYPPCHAKTHGRRSLAVGFLPGAWAAQTDQGQTEEGLTHRRRGAGAHRRAIRSTRRWCASPRYKVDEALVRIAAL